MYPGAIPSYAGFTAGHTLQADNHAAQSNAGQSDIIALATKVGTGSSAPASGLLLRGNGAGTSAWSQVGLTTDVSGVLPQANGGNGTTSATGTGAAVYQVSPALTTPTLSIPAIADFTSANHTHTNSAGGGTLGANAIGTTQIADAAVTSSKIDYTSFDVYSTTETDTGRKWVDGRSIYRKVLLGTVNIGVGSNNIAHDITGFTSAPEFLDIRGTLQLSSAVRSNAFNTFWHRETGGNFINPLDLSTTNLVFNASFAWGVSVYTIILEYVK